MAAPNHNAHNLFPEAEPIDNGDPFLAEIVKADDIIDDHLYNYECLALDQAAAARVVDWVEARRLSYELEWLYHWWGLAS